jgi:plastocyanin
MTRSGIFAAALLLALPVVAAACSEGPNLPFGNQDATPSAGSAQPAAVVTLDYVSFEPGVVTIRQGQTVEWQWLDAPNPHDVVFERFDPANGGAPTSFSAHSAIMISGTWSQVFNEAGTYYYQCSVHPNMSGEVIVTAGAGGGGVAAGTAPTVLGTGAGSS